MTCSVFARILFSASLLKLLYAFNGSIEIERRDQNYTNGKSVYHGIPDTFKIPSTMCSSDISVYCGVMGGHSVGGCKCECNSEETTFGFYDDQWKCTANSKVRQHGGCSLILLSNRTEDSTLITVPLNIQASIDYVMQTNYHRCYIIPYKSKYLLCDGSWKILDNNFVLSKFIMTERGGKEFFTFKNTTSDSEYNEVKGRILRMTIGCYDKSNTIIRNCLLLKMQGTMKCPQFPLPPLPTTSPWTIPPTSAAGTSANELQTHSIRTSLSSQQTTVGYERKKNGAGENDGGNTGLIVGVAVGVIGLTLIIVAIVVIKRRRIKRENKARKSERNPQTAEDGSHEMYTYANAISIGNTNDRLQSSLESPIPVADYVNQGNSDFNISDELEYEIMPNTETADESKAIKQKEETSETLDSTTYCSLVGNVPHVYGSLKGPHKTHDDETDRQVTCISQNKENDTYQQLNTSGQQNHGEYQVPNWSA